MGPAGSGKSTVAVQYAMAAAGRGEHAVVFAFDESIATLNTAQPEYRRLFLAMCEECLPDLDMSRGNTLA